MYTLTMSLRSAAVFAFIGMLVLTVLLGVDFINTILNVSHGLVPAVNLFRSFVGLLATLGLTVFLYVFHRTPR
jgi:hypothetical protein